MTSSSALPPPTGRYIPPGARGRVTTGARGTHFRTEAGLQVHPATSWCMGWWWWCRKFLGVLISLALRRQRLSRPAPSRSRDLPCGYIGDSYGLSGVVVLSRPSIWLDIHFISLRKKLLDFLQASGACLLPTITPPCGHSELSTWSRALKFLSVGMLRIFYFT